MDRNPITFYHESTNHTLTNIGGTLDWPSKPESAKEYPDHPFIQLEPAIGTSIVTPQLLGTLVSPNVVPMDEEVTLEQIGCILKYSYGETAVRNYGGDRLAFRAAPSAGALYPNELYLIANNVKGLGPGLYHYNVTSHGLEQLAVGEAGRGLSKIVHGHEEVLSCPAIFVVTGVPARSVWKYRQRAYRYVCLDGGHLLGNLMTMSAGNGLSCYLLLNFLDKQMNELLDLDDKQEYSLALLSVGRPSEERLPSLSYKAYPCPIKRNMQLPMDIHNTGCFAEGPGKKAMHFKYSFNEGNLSGESNPAFHPNQVLAHRRSRRDFKARTMSENNFRNLLNLEEAFFQGNYTEIPPLFDLVAVARDVEGMEPGAYLMSRTGKCELIKEGQVTHDMARSSLWQDFLNHSAVQFVMWTDLEKAFKQYGARAYRYALIQAGISGEAFYIGASEAGLGACGIGAFFDAEIASYTGIRSANGSILYYVAVGHRD